MLITMCKKDLSIEHKFQMCMLILYLCFIVVPVVSSVDAVNDIGLNQTGVLLTLPAAHSPTCTAERRHKVGDQRTDLYKPMVAVTA